MGLLFAVIYDDQETAKEALDTAEGLEEAGYMKVGESLWVDRQEDGDIKVHDESHGIFGKAAGGAALGGLTGLLFAVPVVGLAVGAVAGGLWGHSSKSGVEKQIEALTHIVSTNMSPGSSAIVMFVESSAPERVIEEIGKHGGKLVSTDLTDEQVAEIQREMDRNAAAENNSAS